MEVNFLNVKSKSRPRRSFIEEARRKQILDVALEQIQTKGLQNTSIQEIANKVNASKWVIYYHFNGREELLNNIWSALIEELFEYRKQRVEMQTTASEKLRGYVEANFDFLKDNLNKIAALFRMGIDLSSPEAKPNPWSEEINRRCFTFLSSILIEGQKNGEFREFSNEILAPIIQGAVDGLSLQWVSTPELFDLDACQNTLLEIIQQYLAGETGHGGKTQ
jgi:TetR/AcrR family transcriptional regulator, fatty acid metabolism regulator protein